MRQLQKPESVNEVTLHKRFLFQAYFTAVHEIKFSMHGGMVKFNWSFLMRFFENTWRVGEIFADKFPQ